MFRVLLIAAALAGVCMIASIVLLDILRMVLAYKLTGSEQAFFVVSFCLVGALVGAIAGATGAIVQAIHQEKGTNERKQR